MVWLAAGLVWVAAFYRLCLSLTQRPTLWRTSFTVALVCCALAFTLYPLRQSLDRALGVPNLASLGSRVILLIGIGFLLVYLSALQVDRVPARLVTSRLAATAAAVVVMVSAWVLAPLHDQTVDDLALRSDALSVVVYGLTAWAFLGWGLVGIAWTCVTRGRTFRRTDPARSVSLLLIGTASLAGLLVVIVWSVALVARHAGSAQAAALIDIGDVILPWPILVDAVGVLSLVVVPYATALLRAGAQRRRLRPLWFSLIRRFPEVHLPLKPRGGPLTRLETAVQRAVVEIHDALRLAMVDLPNDEGVGVEQLAVALHQTVPGGRPAAEALPRSDTRAADVTQLLALARAYGEAG